MPWEKTYKKLFKNNADIMSKITWVFFVVLAVCAVLLIINFIAQRTKAATAIAEDKKKHHRTVSWVSLALAIFSFAAIPIFSIILTILESTGFGDILDGNIKPPNFSFNLGVKLWVLQLAL